MQKPWTAEDYKKWLATRPANAADWSHEDCHAADELIKRTTLEHFSAWLIENVNDRNVREWIHQLASLHFGSVETDAIMTKLNLYPSWMEKAS